MRIINTYWDGTGFIQAQAELFRLWARSWESRGWKTRVIFFNSDEPEAGKISRALARSPRKVHRFNFGLLVSPHLINFSFRPRMLKFKAKNFNSPGWQRAELVFFESESQALNCGRKI